MMPAYVLTGTPGCGKTAILRQLELEGYAVVEEAATDVIALRQALGCREPWREAGFADRVLQLQRRRRLAAMADLVDEVIFFDRSPVCTLALCRYGGERAWPPEAPFHTSVFVVTRTKRGPWQRPGGTTFHFVNDGIESALDQAREAAGDRDVRIAGGAETIQQYLDAGVVDEFSITLAPVLFGTGIRLFDRLDPAHLAIDQSHTDASSRVTHLTYTVGRR
jgi:dihydrofolate reductase